MISMVIHSWHILYAMKPWIIYANEGFDGGFNTKAHCCVWNYMHEGKYHDIGGGQGGGVNAPRDGGNRTLCLVCHGWENHLSVLWVIGLFGSLVLSQRGGLVLPTLWKVCYPLGFATL